LYSVRVMSHFRCSENVGSMIPVLAQGKRLDEAIKKTWLAPTKTLSSHVISLLADTVFARISQSVSRRHRRPLSCAYTTRIMLPKTYTFCIGIKIAEQDGIDSLDGEDNV